MELNEYQYQAMTTCTESSQNFSYMMLNLVGEVGELASKVAKAIRKNETALSCDNNLHWAGPHPDLSDLWQLAGVCSVMGWKLEDIAQMNLSKLKSRKERGVIVGDGDNR